MLLPGLDLLRRYERSWLRPDITAGLTVGAMLVPQSMAYAELAGLPPMAGFHAVLLALIAYALVGSSRHLGVGPEPGTAILAATGVALVARGDPARYTALMATLAAMVGLLGMLGAILRLGFLADLLSQAVLVGYITGVGLTLVVSQLGKATGVALQADGVFSRLVELASRWEEVRPATLGLSLGALAVLAALHRWAPRWPGALLTVALATAVSVAFDLPSHGVDTVGALPARLPELAVPGLAWGDLLALAPTALGILLVGTTDNVLTARAVATRLHYRVRANQELAALGVINLCAAVSHGFPISSSASRTAVPAALGSRTQVVSLVAAACVALTLFGLGPLLAHMPEAALAAVVLSAGVSIVDLDGLRRLRRIDGSELAVALAGALLVVVSGVLVGVLGAVAASVMLTLARVALPHDAILAEAADLDGWVEARRHPEARFEAGLLVYRFDAPLFFANASRFRERVHDVLEANPGRESWVVLDFEGIGTIDATALDMIGELLAELGTQHLVVAITRANDPTLRRLERAGLLEPRGALRNFATINAAVAAFRGR
jgi:high affinity sulfate transporter 1